MWGRLFIRNSITEIIHKEQHYPGEHVAILEPSIFDAVQSAFASRARARGAARLMNPGLLVGRIFDDKGNRMTPSTTKKGARRYRYYVSAVLSQGRKEEAGTVARVSAPEMEALVVNVIRGDPSSAAQDESDRAMIERQLDRIIVKKGTVEITLYTEQKELAISIALPWSPTLTTRKLDIITPPSNDDHKSRPIRAESRARLIEGIAKGRFWLDELVSGAVTDTKQIAAREKCSERSVRTTLSLAFLSPTIVKAAIDGTLPHGGGISRLIELPTDWQDQMPRPPCRGWS